MKKKKVAITGVSRSGMTMFLTSLLWQLENSKETNFPHNQNVKITNFRTIQPGVRMEDKSPYDRYLDVILDEKKWPKRATDIHRVCCQFDLGSGGSKGILSKKFPSLSRRSQQLDILDFPGERIADAAIAACDDFDQWSDHMFDYFDNNPGYSGAGFLLRKALEVENLKFDKAVQAYRETLVSFIRDDRLLISPSVFLLDGKGNRFDDEQLESAASERPCGLDANNQFAPLPEKARKSNTEIARKMRKHFKKYRNKMVQPLFDDLAKSDSLIVLVDIPALLMGGRQRYNDNYRIILDLFHAIKRKKSKIFSSSLKRIAFVATKNDLVSPADIEKETLRNLLKEMSWWVKNLPPNLLSNMKFKWFECSAFQSTRPGKSKNTLKGILMQDNPEKNQQEFPVSPLPDRWPLPLHPWNPGKYQFWDVFPYTLSADHKPPEHTGLDRIFDFAVIHSEDQS